MISVIIPLMPIEPYVSQIGDCIRDIKAQTAETEILVVNQKIHRYINKNKLLNEGFNTSHGEYIWHCDADFRLPDETLLERMKAKLEQDGIDVIYPMFYSPNFKMLKIADGGPFMRRNVLEVYTPRETLLGISLVTFPLLEYCLNKRKFHCSPEFQIEALIDKKYKKRRKGHRDTLKQTTRIKNRIVPKLQEIGAWPV